MEAEKDNHSIKNILIVLLVIVVFIVLKQISNLLIPLVLAALLTILNLPVVSFLHKRKVPKVLITIFVAGITVAVIYGLVNLISSSIEQIIGQIDTLTEQFSNKIESSIVWVGETIPGMNVDSVRDELRKIISTDTITSVVAPALGNFISSFGSSFFLFIFYYLILLSGATSYHEWIAYVIGPDVSGDIRSVWEQTQDSISAYMSIKSLISLFTGVATWIICLAFGLNFALFWGFLAFMLNYLPSIGSMLAMVLPVTMSIIQFDSLGLIIAFFILLLVTQILIGSVIDPIVMGDRLRLNTITVIFGLLFWGYIWGIPGMLLSVPLMVLIRLLLEKSKGLALFARLMGKPEKANGNKTPLITKIIQKYQKKDSEPDSNKKTK